MEYLEPKKDARKSFYKKAKIYRYNNDKSKADKFNILLNYTQFLAEKLGVGDIELN